MFIAICDLPSGSYRMPGHVSTSHHHHCSEHSRHKTSEVFTAVCCNLRYPHCWTPKMEALEYFETSLRHSMSPRKTWIIWKQTLVYEGSFRSARKLKAAALRLYWVCSASLPIQNNKSLLFAVTWCIFICSAPIAVNVSSVLGKWFDNFKNYTRNLHTVLSAPLELQGRVLYTHNVHNYQRNSVFIRRQRLSLNDRHVST